MSTAAADPDERPRLFSRPTAGDVVLATAVVAVAVAFQVTGLDAIPANRSPDALGVLLTVAAVAPLALRRVWPLAVLLACLLGLLLLITFRYSVGATSLGVVVAFYTCTAWGSRRAAKASVAVLAVGIVSAAALGPIDLSLEGALVQVALLVGGWVIGWGVRERRELHAVRATEARYEVEAARRQAEMERERASRATAEERLRITRELHDVLGHAVSVMVVQSGAAEQMLDHDPAAARVALQQIASTGRSSLADIRRVLGRLREDEETPARIEPSPGLDDLPALVARVEAAGLPIRLHLAIGASSALSTGSHPGVELAAYRVVQEALTNCLKHASASSVEVTVAADTDWLSIRVRDDGVGASLQTRRLGPDGSVVPADWAAASGLGLSGMRERVSVYGGDLQAGPSNDGGYLVTARIPLAANETGGMT
ncbi:sensor histidine kinase [Humibacillus sp. DSM 29435]|uniref:sensor histidine kinase n=1 Tax=Humibacillus sp. DSM 29435 TaxID=1869167 RepID=UPI0011130768|nr:sensor histidine kinase [Humibacillus sp. DSM 29435]